MTTFLLLGVIALTTTVSGSKFSFQVTNTGSFNISVGDQLWFESADICVASGYRTYCRDDGSLKKDNFSQYTGSDSYGEFKATHIYWKASDAKFETVVREYSNENTIIFEQIFADNLTGTSVGDTNKVLSVWPSIKIQKYAEDRGFLSYKGKQLGSGVKIGQWQGSPSGLGSGLQDSGPIVVFTITDAVVISAASSFMSTSQYLSKDILQYGVMGGVMEIPSGFSLETIFSLDSGVSLAMDAWGKKLLTRYDKSRDVAESDFTTNYLGYSTDNGAYYYYKTEDGKNYQETIIDVYKYAVKEKIPYKHWLMDSWWYYKGTGGGVKNWTAKTSIFPDGIATVFNATKWPIVAHNRYWSANTDYAKQNGGKWNFIVEPKSHNGLAFPLEQGFWDWLLSDARKWGLHTYEQDWLYNEFSELNCTLSSATLGRQWLMQMGTAANRNGLTIQYCMSWCRHMLQSIEIQSVTQARASVDYHPGKDQWNIGLTSILAHAIAIKPTKDNFWSTSGEKGRYGNDTEPYNRLQSAVSTFSTGPVAPSDKIGGSDVSLIMRSCTAGGKLLQPDRPAVKTDMGIYTSAKLAEGPGGDVWQTRVTLSGHTFHYLLAINTQSVYQMSVQELTGANQTYLAWEANNTNIPQVFDATHPISLPHTDKWTFNVWTAAPVLSNGWVFMGEADSKWVAVSNDRFTNLWLTKDSLFVDVEGEPGEDVNVMLFAPGGTKSISVTCHISPGSKARLAMPDKTCTPL